MVTSDKNNKELLRDTRVEVDLGKIAYNPTASRIILFE